VIHSLSFLTKNAFKFSPPLFPVAYAGVYCIHKYWKEPTEPSP